MRLLIVEDNKKLALSLKKALQTQSYAVDVALDGVQGYDMAAVEDYDAIILDVGLPGRDGFALSRAIRSEKNGTPVLMLTARDAVRDKIEGLDSGADDYLVKPFDFDELLARIRALIRRSNRQPELVLEAGSLALDPVSHIVKRSDKEIPLTAKEYALLEFLMRRAGHIVTRMQLIEHVWDIDVDPLTNVVDVYIGYIRAKIDRAFPGEPPLIQTIKGLGYRIGE